MKMYDGGIIIAGVVIALAFLVGYISKQYFGDDNIVEEVAEKVIEAETGFDLDLTPKTKECR